MKVLTYKIDGHETVYNPVTKEVEQVKRPATVVVECHTKTDFDTKYATAEKTAIPGTIEVSGEFDPEPETETTTDDVLNALLGVTE